MLASFRLLLLFFEDFLRMWFWNSWRFSWTITILVDVLHLSVLLVDIMNCLFLLFKIVAGLHIHSEWCLLHCLSFWRRFVLGLRWRCTFTFFLSNWGVYHSSKSDLRFIFGGWLLLSNRCPWPFPLTRIADICCHFTYGLLSCVLILLFCLLYDHIGELFSFIANAVPTLIVTRNVSSFTGNRDTKAISFELHPRPDDLESFLRCWPIPRLFKRGATGCRRPTGFGVFLPC